uniref:Uncharacterized protein MANES_02G084000 n=1 Tax=Rhizophora mucronata TaxID=61149 RepID=A0A2P2IUZ2_RHIMU
MQSVVYYVAFLPNNCNWPDPSFSRFPSPSPGSRLRHRHRHHRIKPPPTSSVTVSSPNSRSHSSKYIYSSLILHSTTSNCTTNEEQQGRQSNNNKSNHHQHHHPCPHQHQETSVPGQFHVSVEANTHSDPNRGEERPEDENQFKKTPGLFSNMWWADLKAAVGQRINVQGIVSSAGTFFKDRHLALPHVAVPDIRYIDWAELSRRGFKGVVFDKDNTITVPYTLTLCTPLASSVEQCKSVFGSNVAVFSNSAGVKKPAGTAEEVEEHFGCKSSHLVMVGDRPFTDIVYGNRNGFLTILTEPLSLAEEPFIVRQVRELEIFLVHYWFGRGLKPISHCLLSDVRHCVKDLPTMEYFLDC